jgi:general secretion pathway protein I
MQVHHQKTRARQRGFTLLEMMVAMAILAISLVALIDATSNAIRAENHAKLVTAATELARMTLVELEDELQEKGFTDESFGNEKCDTYEEKGFKRFKWCRLVDRVELPGSDQVQNLVSKAIEAKQQLSPGGGGLDPSSLGGFNAGGPPGGSGGTGGPLGAGAGFLSSQFGIVKDVLEQGIRRARIRVIWTELGREQTVEIYEYLTDPRRVDMAISLPALGGLLGGTGGTGGTGGSGRTNPGPSTFGAPGSGGH